MIGLGFLVMIRKDEGWLAVYSNLEGVATRRPAHVVSTGARGYSRKVRKIPGRTKNKEKKQKGNFISNN